MSDEPIDSWAENKVAFAERLGGVTGQEVVGLLSAIMRKEYYLHTTSNGGKTVRRWRGNLIGIPVELTEVMTCNAFPNWDYHVSNVEWEFEFAMVRLSESFSSPHAHDRVNFCGVTVKLTYPRIEGDVEAYRHDMSMIRLMGLGQDIDADGVMVMKNFKK